MLINKALPAGVCLSLLAWGSWAREQAPLSPEPSAVGADELKLVAYIRPNDERSEALEPEWTAARSSTDFPMEWIDGFDGNRAAAPGGRRKRCPDFLPNEYPVIRLLRNGEEPGVDYSGPRTSEEILKFIDRAKRSSQTPAQPLTPEDAETFKSADDFVCIATLPPSETTIRQAFAIVADRYWPEFTFGVLESPDATEAKVTCHKRDDETTHTWTSPPSSEETLKNWILETSRPVITELTPANHQRLLDRGWPMVYILSPSPSVRTSIRADLHTFGRGQYASLTAVTADPAYFPDLPGALGLDPEDGYPAGAVHQLSNGKVYRYPRDRGFTPRELQAWGLDVWQGRVKPWTPPGQEEPAEETTGNVRVVSSHKLKVKDIPGLKIKIGGRERDEL
ncbi:hypothetical protein CSOJ01_00379 [Colletotrichum sojae]|uniref:Thioredoxin domain-containing protein n=1 Tax=Colletotrichum sojae TaxID=2175907 RepID=A0A8H6JWX7_9PEZI|nr:hypothetical protein CSOJ01_00379 [Colletotrichum sojae]